MLTLVVTHGRDNPFGKELEMGQSFENWVRSGLLATGVDYAHTIPVSFAFYGDLWRSDRRALWEHRTSERSLIGDPSARTAIAIADELLTSAGALDPEERAIWASLAQVIARAQQRLPGFIGAELLKHVARDTAEYLTFEELRYLTIKRITDKIEEAAGEVILLGHSMGSIVCYDLLMRFPHLPVRAFISFGSPLGMSVILNRVGGKDGKAPFPAELPRWINVYNQDDFVASVRTLAPMYVSDDGRKVQDLDTGPMQPPGIFHLWRGHDPGDYLTSLALANALKSVIEQ